LDLYNYLAYVPENKVIDSFESLISTDFYEKNQNSLTELLNYFEDTYIGRPNRKGHRRPALFDISIWNCYELIQKDIPCTNNAIEGWHNRFNSMLNAVHSSIWTCISEKPRCLRMFNSRVKILLFNLYFFKYILNSYNQGSKVHTFACFLCYIGKFAN
jgi:hypothetical protein